MVHFFQSLQLDCPKKKFPKTGCFQHTLTKKKYQKLVVFIPFQPRSERCRVCPAVKPFGPWSTSALRPAAGRSHPSHWVPRVVGFRSLISWYFWISLFIKLLIFWVFFWSLIWDLFWCFKNMIFPYVSYGQTMFFCIKKVQPLHPDGDRRSHAQPLGRGHLSSCFGVGGRWFSLDIGWMFCSEKKESKICEVFQKTLIMLSNFRFEIFKGHFSIFWPWLAPRKSRRVPWVARPLCWKSGIDGPDASTCTELSDWKTCVLFDLDPGGFDSSIVSKHKTWSQIGFQHHFAIFSILFQGRFLLTLAVWNKYPVARPVPAAFDLRALTSGIQMPKEKPTASFVPKAQQLGFTVKFGEENNFPKKYGEMTANLENLTSQLFWVLIMMFLFDVFDVLSSCWQKQIQVWVPWSDWTIGPWTLLADGLTFRWSCTANGMLKNPIPRYFSCPASHGKWSKGVNLMPRCDSVNLVEHTVYSP